MFLKLKFGFLESKNSNVKDKKVYNSLDDSEVGIYSGQIKDGEMYGQGELTLVKSGKVFIGNFKQNFIYTGKLTYDHNVYEGSFSAFELKGEGVHHWKDIIEYNGEFNNGKYHGKGKRIRKKYLHSGLFAVTLEGNFENGEPSGKCVAIYANGTVYDGEFANGQRSGFGICKYKDGKGKNHDGSDCIEGYDYNGEEGFVYEGEWYQNKRHGNGKLKNAEGAILVEGIWENNQIKNGNGKKSYENGDIYEGQSKDGEPHGVGVKTFVSGSIYKGDWKEGKRDGQGKMTWNIDSKNYPVKKGYTYDGQWQDDKFTGEGVVRNAEGELVCEGTWEKNKFTEGTFSGEINIGLEVEKTRILNEIDETIRAFNTTEDEEIKEMCEAELPSLKEQLVNLENDIIEDPKDFYAGEMFNSLPHGKGKAIFSSEIEYEGDWEYGKFNGKGKYKSTFSDTYDGDWLEGDFTGIGEYRDDRISYMEEIYIGEWENWKYNGEGKHTYCGIEYIGSWFENHRHGNGKMFNSTEYSSEEESSISWKNEEGFYFFHFLVKGKRSHYDGKVEEGIFIPEVFYEGVNTFNSVCLNTKIQEYLNVKDFQSAIELCEETINYTITKLSDTDPWQDEKPSQEDILFDYVLYPYADGEKEECSIDWRASLNLKAEILALIEDIQNQQLKNSIEAISFLTQNTNENEEKNDQSDDFDDFA